MTSQRVSQLPSSPTMVQYLHRSWCDLCKNTSHTTPLPCLKCSKGFPLPGGQMLHLRGPARPSPTLAETLDRATALLPSFPSSMCAPSQAQSPRTCCSQAWNAIPLHKPMPLHLAQPRRLFSSKPPLQIITKNLPVDVLTIGLLSRAVSSRTSGTGACLFTVFAVHVARSWSQIPVLSDCVNC